MEPFLKRQRLYALIQPEFPQSFDSEEVYYDEDDFVVDEDEGEEDVVEEEQPDYDADSDFQQKRARLDYKLKSTFESIFEKYGKDFDGVGDEIDLATGEIVVNNGHLMEMVDERDAGGISPDPLIDDTEESEDPPSDVLETYGFEEEDEEEDEDEDEEDTEDLDDEDSEDGSDGEMVEDDMILRGFAQANRFAKVSPELGTLRKPAAPPFKPPSLHPQPPHVSKKPAKKGLPTREEILAQFGPQLGPQIVNYVSKQSVPAPSRIEPAWQAPDIPGFRTQKKAAKKRMSFSPEPARSLSPEEATSIWALPRGRGPNKARRSTTHLKGGESSTTPQNNVSLGASSLPHGVVQHGIGTLDNASSPKKHKREKWTEQDEHLLLDSITRARQKGVTVNTTFWKTLAATHPSHNWQSWKYRYDHHFTYLVANSTEDSGVSVSEPSINSGYIPPRTVAAQHEVPAVQQAPVETSHSRPHRNRKPAQTDSRILTWSQAVDALESIDPDIHAGLLDQPRPNTKHALPTQNVFSSQPHFDPPSLLHKITEQPKHRTTASSSKPTPKEVIDLTESDGYQSDVQISIEQVPEREKPMIPGAPCPHADCKRLHTSLYRLQRRDNEELSEMCLHLFTMHHTTPFPCGETGCTRKGTEGYFMQADLVRHVKSTHPGTGPWQRLRGRVDSELLDGNIDAELPPHKKARPNGKAMDSDFMSRRKTSGPQRTSSSQIPLTSDTEPTPRGVKPTSGSSYYAMASFSSMKVGQSSVSRPSPEQIYEDGMNHLDDLSMRAHRSTINSSGGLGARRTNLAESLPPSRTSDEPSHTKGFNPMPTPATGESQGPSAAMFEDKTSSESTVSAEQQFNISNGSFSGTQTLGTTIDETPEPLSPIEKPPGPAVIATSPELPVAATTKLAASASQLQRNIPVPMYDFSDEEALPERREPHPKKTQELNPPLPAATLFPMGPPSSIVKKRVTARSPLITYTKKKQKVAKTAPNAGFPFSTPTAQRTVRQSLLRMALDADDFDELSLDKDDVVLLSSRARTRPLTHQESAIKREVSVNTPSNLPGTSTRKRDFHAFRENASPDELTIIGSSPLKSVPGASNLDIKVEESDTLPHHPNPLPKPNNSRDAGYRKPNSSQITPSLSGRQIVYRTSTPLLNLTPRREDQNPKEIQDSAGSSSPTNVLHPPKRNHAKRQRVADLSSSPPTTITTPTRGKPSADLLRAEQVTVVVKTPGGTLRRCGDGEFACRKSFCFRCGSQGQDQGQSRGLGL